MKKRVLAFVMAAFMLASPLVVCADVVMDNKFYKQHHKELAPLDRNRFVANGPTGSAVSYYEPGQNETADGLLIIIPGSYKNGTVLFINGTYFHEGTLWGYHSAGHNVGDPGWIPMTHLLAVYTPLDFHAENADAFYTYTGRMDGLLQANRLVLWQWPGADREKRVFDDSSYAINDIAVMNAYKDEAGREWGYVEIDYAYGGSDYTWSTEAWVCLTAPANSDIPPFYPAPAPTAWSPDGALVWAHVDGTATTPNEQHSLANLSKVRAYTPDVSFTDVQENAWYYGAIATAYEYDMINGKGNREFDPKGELLIGEALTLASRIHAHYKYGQEDGNRWLTEYGYPFQVRGYASFSRRWNAAFAYCMAEDLVRPIVFYDSVYARYGSDDYRLDAESYHPYLNYPITRAQMVHAWAKILQPADMVKRNTVIALPDADADTPYYEDIRLFYEAGILSGIDAEGTFNPEGNITRAEAATVFMNLIDVSRRGSGRTYGQ